MLGVNNEYDYEYNRDIPGYSDEIKKHDPNQVSEEELKPDFI